MGFKEAIDLFITDGNHNLVKEARDKLRKAKEAAKNPNDWCYHKTDEGVKDERDHFPIYELHVAKKTVAQLKGLTDIPNWWEGEDISAFKQTGLSKIRSRWGDKIDIDKIQAKQVKKKPTHVS